MRKSVDIFTIGGLGRFFTIRWYAEATATMVPGDVEKGRRSRLRRWGKRVLGPGRFALDFYHLSLVFERYR